MKKTPILLLTTFALVTACGGGSKSSSSPLRATPPESTPVVVDEETTKPEIAIDLDVGIEGQYLAVFSTVNYKVTGKITGAFTFSREKEFDELVGDVRLTNAGANLVHAQYVRLGSRCPTLEDDLNSDGYIDATEAEAVYGKVLFPLDGDLTSQSSHDGVFPLGDVYGNYIYSQVTPFSTFISDMRSPLTNDGYHRLTSSEPLDIEGRVVVVHGVDQATDLPTTVGTLNRIVPYQTLPIACGVIKKVGTPPGRIDNGRYPVPPVARPTEVQPPVPQPPMPQPPMPQPPMEVPEAPVRPEITIQPEAPVEPEISADPLTTEVAPEPEVQPEDVIIE